MVDATVRTCAAEGCGKLLGPWQQFGPDYLHPLCREHWQAEQDHGQMSLPEPKQVELFDLLSEERKSK